MPCSCSPALTRWPAFALPPGRARPLRRRSRVGSRCRWAAVLDAREQCARRRCAWRECRACWWFAHAGRCPLKSCWISHVDAHAQREEAPLRKPQKEVAWHRVLPKDVLAGSWCRDQWTMREASLQGRAGPRGGEQVRTCRRNSSPQPTSSGYAPTARANASSACRATSKGSTSSACRASMRSISSAAGRGSAVSRRDETEAVGVAWAALPALSASTLSKGSLVFYFFWKSP